MYIDLNDELKKLYQSKWSCLLENSVGTEAANPLLLKVREDYKTADIRVMIVGQETDGWNGLLSNKKKSVDELMDDYYNYLYNINTGYDNLEKRLKLKKQRPFWNRKNYKYFEEELSKIDTNKKFAFIWNNISKIGNDGENFRGAQKENVKELENKYFSGVFEKEIEILNPNIIIFVTGNRRLPIKYDLLPTELKEVSQVIFYEQFANIISVKTYHPNAQIKGGKVHIKKYIVEFIKNHINHNL